MPAVIVLHYGDPTLTTDCLATVPPTADLVVVDNQGDWPDPTYRPGMNLGFAAGCNIGATLTDSDILVFLNNDCLGHPGWLDALIAEFDEPAVGVVGAKLLYPSGRVQHAGVSVDMSRPFGDEARNITVDLNVGAYDCSAVTGACLAIRRSLFDHVAGFDTGFWNGYEDVDLCLMASSFGARIRYTPDAVLTHLESQSGPERWVRVRQNIQRLRDKWGTV